MQKNYACDSNQKWACSACTYLNWPKTIRCVQCETPRENSDVVSSQQPASSCSGISTTSACNISDGNNETLEKELEDQFASVYISDLNNQTQSGVGNNEESNLRKKYQTNAIPMISSLYITEPSSSSRVIENTSEASNSMFVDEDNENEILCGTNTSALNNTLNTTNLLKDKKPSLLISDFNKPLLKNQNLSGCSSLNDIIIQNDTSSSGLSRSSQQKYKKIHQNFNNSIGGIQPSNKLRSEDINILASGALEFSKNYNSKDSIQNLSNTNKLVSSSTAARSALCNDSSIRDNNLISESDYSSTKNLPSCTSSNSNVGKWTCGVCTYDNWPRSTKCVMCLTPRVNMDTDPFHSRSKPAKAERAGAQNRNHESFILPEIKERESDTGQNNMSQVQLGNNRAEVTSLLSTNNRISTTGSVIGGSPLVGNNRRTTLEIDARWLEACHGVVEGNIIPVEQYLAAGGDPARQLTQFEVAVLNRPSAFDIGFTLIHLALRDAANQQSCCSAGTLLLLVTRLPKECRSRSSFPSQVAYNIFHQEHVLAILLSQVDNQPNVVKRVPSYAAPDLAMDIRRVAMGSLRQRKGSFHCYYTSEVVTFILPSEILDLRPDVQETLFNEILDRDVQKELENGQIINWSVELMGPLNSRLYALWNRSAGDCLLDSVLQATWGIFDRENGLRRALSDSLHECATMFYQRWKENELLHAHLLDFSLNDSQCATDWAKLLSIASKPGSSLEQLHIFALSHILRRPIIVYGVKYVKSFRGETLGYARYEGVYLPFLWDPSFCWKWPIALGYTRGHFSALVGLEPDIMHLPVPGASAQIEGDHINRSIFLPLNSIDGTLLPIHFLTKSEIGKEEMILSQWLDVRFIDSGVMVACQRIQKQPLLVGQMVDEWLNHYRRLGQITSTPYIRHPPAETCYSSDDSDD